MDKTAQITPLSTTKFLIYGGLMLVGFSLFLYLDYMNISIAFDDAYTMRLTQHSFSEIFDITSRDVHPPLYYWMLKIYSSIFGYSIFSQRAFSDLGVLATMLFAAISLRRRFGDRVAIMFIVLLLIFPVTQYLASEIRMYSWAVFFTSTASIFAYDVYNKGGKGNYLKMGIMSLCAIYTHYYAAMTIGWIFIILFIFLIKEKKKILPFITTVIILAFLYLPWISHLIFQLQKVNNDFWIENIDSEDLLFHLYYFYSVKKDWLPFSGQVNNIFMYLSIMIIACQAIIVGKELLLFFRKKDRKNKLIFILLTVFILPVLSGLIISVIIKPVIVPRYMLCSFGPLLLCLSMAYVKNISIRKYAGLVILSLALLLISSAIRFYGNIKFLDKEHKEYKAMELFIEKHKNSTGIFLSEYYAASALSRLSVLHPEKKYYILTPKESTENFEPFSLQKIHRDQKFDTEFILVQKKQIEKEGNVAIKFKTALKSHFIITDSISALNMELYKMSIR